MKKILHIFFVVLLIANGSLAQSYLDNFTGIPIITFGWTTNDDWLHDYDYNKIKEMGTDVLVAPDLLYTKFDIFRLANLKLIPYQTDTTFTRTNLIAKYTDAIYSVWETESVPISQGEIQLTRDLTKVDEIPGVGVKTKNNNPGYIITGPNYIQPIKYSIDTVGPGLITYYVNFKLKVEPNVNPVVPLTNNVDNICRIEVTSGGIPLASSIIQANQFVNYEVWKDFELTYSQNNNASMKTNQPLKTSYLLNGTQNTDIEIFSNVEFKIYYYGTANYYLNLYVDNILVYDNARGNPLFTSQAIQQNIIKQANNTNNVNNITTSQSDFDNTVVGWYPADEASFIDQWACVKKIAELIKNNTNGKKLVASIAGNWNGRVYEGSSVYRVDELIRRTNLEEVIMDNYIFNYPYNENVSDYQNLNIQNMVLNHLDRLNNFNLPFVLNVQVGKWNYEDKIPTPEQLKNTVFLGLLYGAKGIGINNYFFKSERSDTSYFLVSFHYNGNGYDYTYTPLWSTIKNEIAPVLSDTFGQTIKTLNQQIQGNNYDAVSATTINDSYWVKKIRVTTSLNQLLADKCYVDYGYFSNPSDLSQKYFMIVNRYYSTMSGFEITLKNLSQYKNWEVKNFINSAVTGIQKTFIPFLSPSVTKVLKTESGSALILFATVIPDKSLSSIS